MELEAVLRGMYSYKCPNGGQLRHRVRAQVRSRMVVPLWVRLGADVCLDGTLPVTTPAALLYVVLFRLLFSHGFLSVHLVVRPSAFICRTTAHKNPDPAMVPRRLLKIQRHCLTL